MAAHSSILAWRILWTKEPDGLLSMGLHRVRHDWSDLACIASSSHEFCMMSSAYKLNKQAEDILPWRTPFPIWNLSIIPFVVLVLTIASWPAHRFLRMQIRWSGLFKSFPQFVAIHTVKGFSVVNEAEVYVFLKFSCSFDDPADVGNLISGSSALLKSSLNIWKFLVHLLLKLSLENFEHYLYEKRLHSVRHIWVPVFISPLICCVTWGKSLKCSEHCLPLL